MTPPTPWSTTAEPTSSQPAQPVQRLRARPPETLARPLSFTCALWPETATAIYLAHKRFDATRKAMKPALRCPQLRFPNEFIRPLSLRGNLQTERSDHPLFGLQTHLGRDRLLARLFFAAAPAHPPTVKLPSNSIASLPGHSRVSNFSANNLPIFKEAVAAGEGALHTFNTRSLS